MTHDDAGSAELDPTKVVLDVVPSPAKVALMIAKMVAGPTANERLAAAISEEIHDAVFGRLPDVVTRVKQLEDKGVPVNATDLGRVVEHFTFAWRKAADSKKRKILEDAFVRSFDCELYESGLLNALWERLDRLCYGDLFLLRDLVEAGESRDAVKAKHQLSSHNSLGRFHGSNLDREGLVWNPFGKTSVDGIRPNELGLRLYRLAWENLPEPEPAGV